MEIGGWIVFGGVAVFLLYRWRKNGRPDTAALLFIGCFTMWWQEFYAERVLGVRPVITTVGQRAYQIVAWIIAMDVLYAVFLTLPLVIAPILFFPDNPWVPKP